MRVPTSKVASVHVFVVLCFTVFGSLILCYVTFGSDGDLRQELEFKIENSTIKDAARVKTEIKNILMWTHDYTEPFKFFKQGRQHFITAGCQFNNCYLTNKKKYLDNVTRWDAILFHAPEYTKSGNPWHHPLPEGRSAHQEYVFVSVESGSNYPICDAKWENYFNWTMTYMLDSDVPWPYLAVRERSTNSVIGPGDDIRWKDSMQNLSEDLESIIKAKTKPVAWFVSNCKTIGKREDYAKELKKEMEALGMTLDIYGMCGQLSCPSGNKSSCLKMLQAEYRFYLSFENTFNTDYVTEKLLTALQNDVVPIVWGGANYTRFAPPDSYLDAREHSPSALAELIHGLMRDTDAYAAFFKRIRSYSYHLVYDSYETHPVCRLCKALNDPDMTKRRIKEDIRAWWNGERGLKYC